MSDENFKFQTKKKKKRKEEKNFFLNKKQTKEKKKVTAWRSGWKPFEYLQIS